MHNKHKFFLMIVIFTINLFIFIIVYINDFYCFFFIQHKPEYNNHKLQKSGFYYIFKLINPFIIAKVDNILPIVYMEYNERIFSILLTKLSIKIYCS